MVGVRPLGEYTDMLLSQLRALLVLTPRVKLIPLENSVWILGEIAELISRRGTDGKGTLIGNYTDWVQYSRDLVIAGSQNRRLERALLRPVSSLNSNDPKEMGLAEAKSLLFITAYIEILELVTRMYIFR